MKKTLFIFLSSLILLALLLSCTKDANTISPSKISDSFSSKVSIKTNGEINTEFSLTYTSKNNYSIVFSYPATISGLSFSRIGKQYEASYLSLKRKSESLPVSEKSYIVELLNILNSYKLEKNYKTQTDNSSLVFIFTDENSSQYKIFVNRETYSIEKIANSRFTATFS